MPRRAELVLRVLLSSICVEREVAVARIARNAVQVRRSAENCIVPLSQVVSRDPTEQAPATPSLSSSRNDTQGLYASAWDPNKTKYQPPICDVLAAPSSVLSDRQQESLGEHTQKFIGP